MLEPSNSFHKLCPADDLADGARRTFDVEGTRILVIRSGSDVHAISALCSHASLELKDGDVREGAIRCPFHGARFDLATGRCVTGGGIGPIETYPTALVEGDIYVSVD